MKKLIYGLYALFTVLIALTFYMANTVYDGLVEEDYYEKSKKYFETRKTEEEIGLTVTFDTQLKVGSNDISIRIEKSDGPVNGALITLFVGTIASTEYDTTFVLNEASPGVYTSQVEIPSVGRWLVRADIDHRDIRTERIWDLHIE